MEFMKLEYAKDPVWSDAEHTSITLFIKLDGFPEELPFTANPNDPEQHGREIFAAALAGDYGSVREYAPYVPTGEEAALQAYNLRNGLLVESDWTQLPDARAAMGAEKAAEWEAYRQALRDITDQPGYPTEINWPVAPQ
jgi:hypothetical protein